MTINYLKSIKKGQVCTSKMHLIDKAEIIVFYFIHVVIFLGYLLVLSSYMLINDYLAHDNISGFGIVFGGGQFILGIYLVFCLLNWRKLIKIDGIDINTNKELLIPIVNGYYPGLSYEWDGEILIGSRPFNNWTWKQSSGLNIVLIFNDKDIYINIVTIYKAGPNPWMAFTNIDRAREIGNMFKEKVRYRPIVTQQCT